MVDWTIWVSSVIKAINLLRLSVVVLIILTIFILLKVCFFGYDTRAERVRNGSLTNDYEEAQNFLIEMREKYNESEGWKEEKSCIEERSNEALRYVAMCEYYRKYKIKK